MPRNLSAALKAALAEDSLIVVNLLEIRLDTGSFYITDAYADVSYDGNTYTGLGQLLGFDETEETLTLAANDVRVTLSGVDQTWLATFLNTQFINRTAILLLAVIDKNDYSLIDAFVKMRGRIDEPIASDNPDAGTSTVSVRIVNPWADQRINGRRTNNEQQQKIFPGDLGFAHAHEVDKRLEWGRPGTPESNIWPGQPDPFNQRWI